MEILVSKFMIVKDSFLLIDIGGTHIEVYEFEPKSKIIKLIDRLYSSQIQINSWINSLSQIYHFREYERIICGLPGEVESLNTRIYCAPLGLVINIEKALDNGIEIVNDMYIQAFILASSINNLEEDLYIITIGTSIGLCIVQGGFNKKYNLNYVSSYEFAHESISLASNNLELLNLICKNTGFRIKKYCSLYSVGGFAAANGLEVEVNKDQIIRINKKEFFDSVVLEKLNDSTTKLWFNSLKADLEKYLKKYSSSKSNYNTVIRGGLYNALKKSTYKKYLSNFNLEI